MLPKCPNPTTMDDMRNLGLSPFFNKGLEQILVSWLLPYVGKFLTRDQFGGRKGSAVNHYLARLVDFLYTELDRGSAKDRRAVATMAIDLSKAFNRLYHGKLITMMYNMGVPICAIRLLKSYLTNRTMRVHLSDAKSMVYELWGGGPQGGLLTVLLFNLYSNWISDLCQPNLSQDERFLLTGRVVFPRCSLAQQRDCPPDVLGQTSHVCHQVPPCS